MEKICKNCRYSKKQFFGGIYCEQLNVSTDNNFNCCRFEVEKQKKDNTKQIINQILLDLQKAKEKHPEWPTNLAHQVLIMGEESGEVQKAALNIIEKKGTYEELREELYQTAAMCIRILENL